MNYNKKVILFTLSAIVLLLGISIYKEVTGNALPGFAGISLLEDITSSPGSDKGLPAKVAVGSRTLSGPTATPAKVNKDAWQLPQILTAFHDTASPALPGLMERLHDLKAGRRRKVRIAWLGDSMIEGDLITQTIRKELQKYFGGSGAGFVKVQSLDSRSRSSVTLRTEGTWKDEKFGSTHTAPIFFSGHVFFPVNGTTILEDNTSKDTNTVLTRHLIYGGAPGTFTASVNDRMVTFEAPNLYNRVLIDSSTTKKIRLNIQAPELPVYGISVETPTGIVIDNFSYRGITGVELAQLDDAFLQSMMAGEPYDLIVFQYGVNLLFRPKDVSYPWYAQKMEPVFQRLKGAMPGAEFLLLSAGDRAFRYDGEWKTGIGVDSLVVLQAGLAQQFGMAFYNLYQSMGGAGSVVAWANSDPPKANKDYIHPNHKGAAILGEGIANAFLADYRKWQSQRAAGQP